MDNLIERGLLFDFYGELLTKHQQKIYDEAVNNDLSLSELSEDIGISRQGIHDIIKRCDKQLEQYEDKLRLIEKFKNIKTTINGIDAMIDEKSVPNEATRFKIKKELERIIEDL